MYSDLVNTCFGGNVYRNQSFKKLTTIHIGGVAKFVAEPVLDSQVIALVGFLQARKVPYVVLGAGSNVLACDSDFEGVVIHMTRLNQIARHGYYLHVGGGCKLSALIGFATKAGLGGLQDGIGIPGTIAGAVVMNASAYQFETAKIVRGVHVFRNGRLQYIKRRDCQFGYRSSAFKKGDIILSVDIYLQPADPDVLRDRMLTVIQRRKALPSEPSLGSVFKRKDGIIVSRMLDDLGFKGFGIGGAMVSDAHAGIIVNRYQAKACEVKALIRHIQQTCRETVHIELEPEIHFLEDLIVQPASTAK